MSSGPDFPGERFSVRSYSGLLNAALAEACLLWGVATDEATRAGLGFFILKGARAGERNVRALAENALVQLRADPDILRDVEW